MLTPEYLQHAAEGAEAITEDLHNRIMRKIVKAILTRMERGENYMLTAADKWRIEALQEAGYLLEDIQKEIAKATNQQLSEIKSACVDAGIQTLKWDDAVYKAAGLVPTPLLLSPTLMRVLERDYKATAGTWRNFTRTTAEEAQRLFINELDSAYHRVLSGGESYGAVVADLIEKVSEEGLTVKYPTGYRQSLESATMTIVRTGIAQAACDVSEARMEEGNMRADVNVSLRNSPSDPFGTRSETKNVNSFRGIEKTIQYEIRRQAAILSEGGEILQETRHWDEASQTTAGGRVKSDADDYRYFPDPDLVMLHITKEHIEEMKAQMPEMPRERRNRLKGEWGFNDLEMRDVLNADALDLLEETVKAGATAAGAKKWWLGELSREANNKGVSLEELPIAPVDVAEVEKLIADGKLNDKLAKQTVAGVLAGEGTPDEVVKKHGFQVVSDDGALEKAVNEALAANPDIVEKLKSGNMKPMGAIIGAVMRATRGQADAKAVTKIVMSKIK